MPHPADGPHMAQKVGTTRVPEELFGFIPGLETVCLVMAHSLLRTARFSDRFLDAIATGR
jgi:hypothetical protein